MKSLFLNFLLFNLLLSLSKCSFQDSFFIETNKNYTGKNLIVSPLSIYQALSLTANGAKTKTLKEMLSLLQSKGLSELNEINFDILEVIKHCSTVEIANAVMVREFTPIEEFIDISEKYLAPTCELESLEQVNNWCSEKTHGKIPKILEKLDRDVILIILNAIYFKGTWKTEFEKSKTELKPFYNLGITDEKAEENMVETMNLQSEFNYFETENFQSIELPYKDDQMSAIIILPSVNISINDFIEDYLSEDLLNKINKLMIPFKVNIDLPKFELSFSAKMKNILIDMGMVTAFTGDADFSGIIEDGGMQISQVIQKTYLKVDEEGSEAAAVTAVIGTRGLPSATFDEIVIQMKVNRPFLFILRNKDLPKGNDILMLSKIEKIDG